MFIADTHKKGHNSILSRTIKLNQRTFPFKVKDVLLAKDIYLYYKYKTWFESKGSIADLAQFLKEGEQNELYIELNIPVLINKELFEEEGLHKQVDLIVQPKINSSFDIKYYTYLEKSETKLITVLEYVSDSFILSGQVFGEHDSDSRRNTVQAMEPTVLGRIDEAEYVELVINEKNKNIIKEVMYLVDSFYFQSIKPNIFKKRYFSDFKKCIIPRGETLLKEGEYFSHLFLIKEGEIELTINQNFLDLNNLINILEEKVGTNWEDKASIKSGKNNLT